MDRQERTGMHATTKEFFRYTGLKMTSIPTQSSIQQQNRAFRESFGVHWIHCAIVWKLIAPELCLQHGCFAKKEHLLWCLLFLKVYSKNQTDNRTAKTTQKTFRKWVWLIIEAIADCESEVVSNIFIWIELKKRIGKIYYLLLTFIFLSNHLLHHYFWCIFFIFFAPSFVLPSFKDITGE